MGSLRFSWSLSGELLCELPRALDLEASRQAVARLLGTSAHCVHLLDLEGTPLTSSSHSELQSCAVLVFAGYRLRCAVCDVELLCRCGAGAGCGCVDSPVTVGPKLRCAACEPPPLVATDAEGDEATFRLAWPGRAECVVCASSRCRCSLAGARRPCRHVGRRRGAAKRAAVFFDPPLS